MDPISATLAATATKAVVRAVLSGEGPGPDEWASIVGELLGVVVAQQDDVTRRLDVIETKIDALAARRYDDSFNAAQLLCESAMVSWRTQDDRVDLLRQARNSLIQAKASSEGDPIRLAAANWSLAVVYYCLQMFEDCRASLIDSYRGALSALSNHALKAGMPAFPLMFVKDFWGTLQQTRHRTFTARDGMTLTSRAAELVDQWRRQHLKEARAAEVIVSRAVAFRDVVGSAPGITPAFLGEGSTVASLTLLDGWFLPVVHCPGAESAWLPPTEVAWKESDSDDGSFRYPKFPGASIRISNLAWTDQSPLFVHVTVESPECSPGFDLDADIARTELLEHSWLRGVRVVPRMDIEMDDEDPYEIHGDEVSVLENMIQLSTGSTLPEWVPIDGPFKDSLDGDHILRLSMGNPAHILLYRIPAPEGDQHRGSTFTTAR